MVVGELPVVIFGLKEVQKEGLKDPLLCSVQKGNAHVSLNSSQSLVSITLAELRSLHTAASAALRGGNIPESFRCRLTTWEPLVPFSKQTPLGLSLA